MFYTHQALSGACQTIARLQPGLPPITANRLRSMSPEDFYVTQKVLVEAIWDSAGNLKERSLFATKWLPIAATFARNFRASGNENWRTRDQFCAGFLDIANYLIRHDRSNTARESALAYFNLNEMLGAVWSTKYYISDFCRTYYDTFCHRDIEADAFIVSSFAYFVEKHVQNLLLNITINYYLGEKARFRNLVQSAPSSNFFKNLLQSAHALGFSKIIGYSLQSFLQVIRERESTLPDKRALGVILQTRHDYTPYPLEKIDHAANMQAAGLRTFYYEVGSNEVARLAMQDAARLQRISYLLFNAHGDFGRLAWSKNSSTSKLECMHITDVENIFGAVKDRFIEGAVIIIASCLSAAVNEANPISLVEAVSRAIPQALVLGMSDSPDTLVFHKLFSLTSEQVVIQFGRGGRRLEVAPVCFQGGHAAELPPNVEYWLSPS